MSPLVHILSITAPGCVLPDKKSFPCSGGCRVDHVASSRHAGILLRKTSSNFRASFIRAAISNNHRRNPDFSRQNKGFSKGRSRQSNQDKESSDNVDFLSSKNGPLQSLSSNPRYQATATPGQREKEIVELFRKVQTQLRERAAAKEEKKMESSQQVQGERGTVDSLLKLLRKHSVDQGKKGGDEEDNAEQSERNSSFEEEQSSFFETSSFASEEEIQENAPRVPFTRPVSKFQRKSPVPRVKFQPVYSADETVVPDLSIDSAVKKKKKKKKNVTAPADLEPEEPVFFDEREEEFEDEHSESSYIDDEVEVEVAEPSVTVTSDLSSMKLTELRELAKSRGVKGYSKLKKVELVKLLAGDGT